MGGSWRRPDARWASATRSWAIAPGRRPFTAVREALLEVSGTGGPRSRPTLIVAAGMLSSEVGLVTVPHVPAPAGLDELADARRSGRSRGRRGRSFRAGGAARGGGDRRLDAADVMRGEECETLGALSRLTRLGLDGRAEGRRSSSGRARTRSWSRSTAGGRITGSQTSLAGELLQAVAGTR